MSEENKFTYPSELDFDQFAIAYLMQSSDKVDLKAIMAAPFLTIGQCSRGSQRKGGLYL